MEKLKHWTHQSADNFVYAIASDFVAQIETRMEQEGMDRKTFARKAQVTPGRVSQFMNNPASLNLRSIVKYAFAADRKVAIVTYDDKDPRNERGPIDAGVFSACWQQAGCPRDLFEVHGTPNGQAILVFIGQKPYGTCSYSNVLLEIEKSRKDILPTINNLEQMTYAEQQKTEIEQRASN